jgi:hypothetical protein
MRALAHLRRAAALAGALTAASLVLASSAPAAQQRSAVHLSMHVLFTDTGEISVTLPDGSPVGTKSGAPTTIPAGYYSLLLSGPGACTLVPYFVLNGPGVAISDNMDQGEEEFLEYVVDLQPNSTYTWRNGDAPNVTYTFQTSSQVLGTKAPQAIWTGPVTSKSSNKDIVGSGLPATRGALTATVTAAGKLNLTFKGKKVTTLRSGRYTLTVVDGSPWSGFVAQPAKKKAQNLTNAPFVGRRTATMQLSKGKWLFMTGPGASALSVTVR